jgi:hypothetical protein
MASRIAAAAPSTSGIKTGSTSSGRRYELYRPALEKEHSDKASEVQVKPRRTISTVKVTSSTARVS